MTKNIDAVKSAFRALESEGFHRKGKRWIRRSTETIVIVDLQKEQGIGIGQPTLQPYWWGPQPVTYFPYYYVNFGVWLLEAGEPPAPWQEERYHLRRRLGDDVEHALHLGYKMDPDERSDLLNKLVRETVIPLADQCKTKTGCVEEVSAGRFYWVLPEAEQILGVRKGLSDADRQRLEAEIADENTTPECAARLRSILDSYPTKNPDE